MFAPEALGGARSAERSGNATPKGGQRGAPLVEASCLPRAEVDADRAELGSARGLRSATEDVGTPGDLEVHEAGCHDRGLELCLQQSAGASTLPEVDVSLRSLRYGL